MDMLYLGWYIDGWPVECPQSCFQGGMPTFKITYVSDHDTRDVRNMGHGREDLPRGLLVRNYTEAELKLDLLGAFKRAAMFRG